MHYYVNFLARSCGILIKFFPITTERSEPQTTLSHWQIWGGGVVQNVPPPLPRQVGGNLIISIVFMHL